MPEKGKIEWNLNTWVIIGGAVIGVFSTGTAYGVLQNRQAAADEKTELWQQRHEQLHRERLAQTTAENTRTDQRLNQHEISLRKLENLEYRITVAEQAGINTGKSIERLTDTVNGQSADIRVMREIIERQFGTSFQRPARR
ncbi:hypothetical protein OIU35_31465 [Boseaceae bacterium BT-24-1]|nr:hypothetical protein [Boseaceae bacterium BT-24-1]